MHAQCTFSGMSRSKEISCPIFLTTMPSDFYVSRYVTRTIQQAVISIQTRCTQLSNNVFTPVTSVTIMPGLTNTSNE